MGAWEVAMALQSCSLRLICWATAQFKLPLGMPGVNDAHDVAALGLGGLD